LATTSAALSARTNERDDHAIADGYVVHEFPDLDHTPGGLVAVDGGERSAPSTVDVGDVAVADRHGFDLDANLVRKRSA
jgi:hypothetical protein